MKLKRTGKTDIGSGTTGEGLDVGSINNLVGTSSTAMNMAGFYLKLKIAGIILALFTLTTVVFYVYFRFFYAKRLRWAKWSIMIDLEPEIQFFSEKISTFISEYNRSTSSKFDYTDNNILENLYFFETINDNAIRSAMAQLRSMLIRTDIVYDGERHDEYQESVTKFINTRFNWSKSDKMDRNAANLRKNDRLFERLDQIAEHRYDFETYLDTLSLFNYLDLTEMDIDGIRNNKLLRKYGKYLPGNEGLMGYVTPIREAMAEAHANNVTKLDQHIVDFPSFFGREASDKSVDEMVLLTMSAIRELMLRVFMEYHGVPLETFADSTYVFQSACSSTQTERVEEDNRIVNSEELNNHIAMLRMIENLIAFFETHTEDGLRLLSEFKDHYIYVEKIAYEQFDSVTQKNIFTTTDSNRIVSYYQSVIDFIYLKAYTPQIEAAVKFTLYFMLDTNSNKDVKLDQLTSLYLSFTDVFIAKEYRRRLDAYDNSRKPDLKKLKEMYIKTLDNYFDYYVIKCTWDQWIDLFTAKRPSKYRWILDWLRKAIGTKSLEDIMMMIFPDINNKATGVVDSVFDGLDDVVNAVSSVKNAIVGVVEHVPILGDVISFVNDGVDFLKELAEYAIKFMRAILKLTMYMLTLVTKPQKFLEFFARAVIFIIAVMLKMAMYLVKLNDIYLLGEFLMYVVVMVFFTLRNLTFWISLSVITFVVMILDVNVFKGWIYKILYWLFGASENSPRAWYMRTGYHYGFDTCKTDGFCKNRYQNKVMRMFFAWKECGENYKPDRMTYGLMCKRKYMNEPGFCMQANINRLRENMHHKTPHVPGSFIPDTDYFDAPRAKRIKITDDFKKMKKLFYTNCESAMVPYDSLSKNICRVYPEVAPYSKHRSIESLCYNTYCVNGKNEPFCYKFNGDGILINSQSTGDGTNIYTRMSVIVVYIIIVTYIINTFVKKV